MTANSTLLCVNCPSFFFVVVARLVGQSILSRNGNKGVEALSCHHNERSPPLIASSFTEILLVWLTPTISKLHSFVSRQIPTRCHRRLFKCSVHCYSIRADFRMFTLACSFHRYIMWLVFTGMPNETLQFTVLKIKYE